jgi:hypothetical protein
MELHVDTLKPDCQGSQQSCGYKGFHGDLWNYEIRRFYATVLHNESTRDLKRFDFWLLHAGAVTDKRKPEALSPLAFDR